MSESSSPVDDLNPPANPTSPPRIKGTEVSDDDLLSSPTTSPSHPLQPSSSSSSSSSSPPSSTNGFSHGHGHHPPNLRLQGLSHIEPFYPTDGSAAPSATADGTTTASQPSSPSGPSSQSSSPTSTSVPSTFFPNMTGPSSDSPVPLAHMKASPSIGTLAAATFAGMKSDPSNLVPPTPTTSTGYNSTNVVTTPSSHQQPSNVQMNGHTNNNNFFAPSRPNSVTAGHQLQLQPISTSHSSHPQSYPPSSFQPQSQPHPQQPMQRNSGGATTPAAASGKASSGFLSKLFKKEDTPPRGPVERPPPLPIYMQRLRLTHDWHYKNIHQLADRKKKYEQKHQEEVTQWMNWALYPLATIAHAFYMKNLQHLNALLSLEGKFMDKAIEHITVVNAVCEGKLSEAVIMKDMMSAAGDGSVKAQVEVDAMFWPADAEETKAVCKKLYEETKRLESQYLEMQAKMKKRESVEVRRKRVQDMLTRGLVHKDTISADPFHHHPLDVKVQQQFNVLMMDQRGEEGKLMKRFMDMQVTHKDRMQPREINHFVGYMIGSVIKSYNLDERTEVVLRVYTSRLIFPRIPEAMAALITAEERDKCRQLAGKVAWLRTLTPHQLGIEEENIPPDFVHDPNYTPLAAPPGTTPELLSPRSSPTNAEEKKDGQEPPTTQPSTLPSTPSTPAPSTPFSPSATSHPELFSPHPPRVDDDIPKKMVPDTFPYADAINQLALLTYDVVPFDMFFRVVSAVRLVHTYHKQYTRANREARARAQSRALTYDDPFTSFMTKLVEESNRKAEELDRVDEEERERKMKEMKEAEAKKVQEAALKHSPHSGAAAPPSPLATLVTTADPPLPPLDGESLPPAAAPAAESPSAAAAPSSATLSAPVTPQKIDHPLAPHHTSPPPPPSEPAHFTTPSPVPSLPQPVPPIPERPQEETPLNADQLTPLCVWLVIHANVPSLPAKLGQIQRFVHQDWIRFGEAGYSFCQVETAAYYVEQLTKETLGQVRAGGVEEVGGGVGTYEGSEGDRVSSPAGMRESPSANLLSPGVGPTHSASMDSGFRRKGTQEDIFGDLLTRQTNADLPSLADGGKPEEKQEEK